MIRKDTPEIAPLFKLPPSTTVIPFSIESPSAAFTLRRHHTRFQGKQIRLEGKTKKETAKDEKVLVVFNTGEGRIVPL
jgi:hypothetical protein